MIGMVMHMPAPSGARPEPARPAPLATAAIAVLALAMSARSLGAQTITGRVLDAASGTPVAGAEIRLLDGTAEVIARELSNAEGWFRFADLTAGTYALEVDRFGTSHTAAAHWSWTGTVRAGSRSRCSRSRSRSRRSA